MKQVDIALWVQKQEIVAHVSFKPQVACQHLTCPNLVIISPTKKKNYTKKYFYTNNLPKGFYWYTNEWMKLWIRKGTLKQIIHIKVANVHVRKAHTPNIKALVYLNLGSDSLVIIGCKYVIFECAI